MYSAKDWALAAGIVFYVIGAGIAASAPPPIGPSLATVFAISCAAMAAVCAYYFGARAPDRIVEDVAAEGNRDETSAYPPD